MNVTSKQKDNEENLFSASVIVLVWLLNKSV